MSAYYAGDPGSIHGSGRSSGEENGNPLQYLAWKIPWTEESGRLQSMGLQRAEHDWATSLSFFTYLLNRVFFPQDLNKSVLITHTEQVFIAFAFVTSCYLITFSEGVAVHQWVNIMCYFPWNTGIHTFKHPWPHYFGYPSLPSSNFL